MSYKIDYQPTRKVRGLEKRTAPRSALTALFFLVFLVLTLSLWPKGAETVRALVIPGDAAVTVAALENLAVDLRAGERVQAALEGFCRQVAGESLD